MGRYLTQLDGLKSYFLSCGEAETAKVRTIVERLEHPLTKPILLFLSYILPSMDRKVDRNTTRQVDSEMSRLVRLFASNLLKPEAIVAAGENLSILSMATTDQLPNENLGLGDDTWAFISSLEEEQDVTAFFRAVRSLYVASLTKMLKKFPFGDTILKYLGIINPHQVRSYSFDTIKSLANRFKQLDLSDAESLGKLREEFMDFTLSPGDLPDPSLYKSASGEKPRAGVLWIEVGRMKTLDGELRFPLLFRLMASLLTIPASNADSERGFSTLKKIHTDQRPSLKSSTIAALMSIRINSEQCCYDTPFTPELHSMCKKATVQSLHHE